MNDFEGSLNELLVNTFNLILKYEEIYLKMISDAPVTITEVHIIAAIVKKQGNSTVSDISNSLSISMPTATVAVKKLRRKGFVSKVPCADDGRRFIINLTELGEKVNKAHNIFHRRMVRNISGEFKENEKEILLSTIKKLNKFFQEKVDI